MTLHVSSMMGSEAEWGPGREEEVVAGGTSQCSQASSVFCSRNSQTPALKSDQSLQSPPVPHFGLHWGTARGRGRRGKTRWCSTGQLGEHKSPQSWKRGSPMLRLAPWGLWPALPLSLLSRRLQWPPDTYPCCLSLICNLLKAHYFPIPASNPPEDPHCS